MRGLGEGLIQGPLLVAKTARTLVPTLALGPTLKTLSVIALPAAALASVTLGPLLAMAQAAGGGEVGWDKAGQWLDRVAAHGGEGHVDVGDLLGQPAQTWNLMKNW